MRPHGRRAKVDPTNPLAFAQCDRCGFWYNRDGLQWQYQWAGTGLQNQGVLVCDICYDTPQEQLRTIILPPDPPSIPNARPPNFAYQEAGPVQSILTATVLQGDTNLPVESSSGFQVGDYIWVQLVDASYSANISFSQIQVVSIAPNSLGISGPLPGRAPINGCVTVSSTVVPAPAAGGVQSHFGSVGFSGSGGAAAQHQSGTVWFATITFSGVGG